MTLDDRWPNYTDRHQIDCLECRGTGGPDAIWDEDLNKHHQFICGHCAGRGWRWYYPE